MTELCLVRHGQTDWNLAGRWQGQSPAAPELNETGRNQALAAQKLLSGKQFSALYSSDLPRCRQTAELLAAALGLPVSLEPRLREIDLGDWEGMLSTDIQTQYPDQLAERLRDPLHTRAPHGETPLEVAERVLAALGEIESQHPDGSVLIVAHGVSLAVIICQAEGFPLKEVYEHVPANAQPYYLQWPALHKVEK